MVLAQTSDAGYLTCCQFMVEMVFNVINYLLQFWTWKPSLVLVQPKLSDRIPLDELFS